MQSIEYRYLHDPMVKALVDYLEHSIHSLQFTPSEIRECAMLAAIHYEQRRPPQGIMEAKLAHQCQPVRNKRGRTGQHPLAGTLCAFFGESI